MNCSPGGAARQPRDRRALHARLDLQGDHRRRRARLGHLHAGLRASTTRATAPSTARRSRTSPTRAAPRSSDASASCTALEHSINAVFCEIGKKLGPLKVLDYAKRFGFYDDPPLETPSERAVAERAVRPRPPLPAARREPGRPGPPRVRAGATPGDAAPDGDGRRRDRQRRRRHAARTSSRRSRRRTARPSRAPSRRSTRGAISPQTADELTHDDGGGRPVAAPARPRRSPASRSPARRAPPRRARPA